MSVTWIGSPNFSGGRMGFKPSKIVIHWMAGTMAAADATFQNTQRQTSAHYGVEDTKVHQYVRESDTAWHSGKWLTNLQSIGIEHSAQPGRNASDATYRSSGQLVAEICKRWGIPLDRAHIIKHSEVIPTQCPGTVNLDRIISEAKSYLANEDEFMGHTAKDAWTEAIRGFIYEYTGNFHSLSDVRKNHMNKTRENIPTVKGFQSERRKMLGQLELSPSQIETYMTGSGKNKKFPEVAKEAG